jgi:hypothetical protein
MTTHLRLTLVVALLVATTAVAAQDYIFTTFQFAHKDYTLPPAPCFSAHPTMPLVYDGSAWMVYTCADGQTIVRRFYHPVDTTRVQGGTVAPQGPAVAPTDSCLSVQPGPDWRCVQGGWLPPGR